MPPRNSERLHSCRVLCSILQHEGSLASLPSALATSELNAALVQELCYGVCRWYHRLHFVAQRLLEKPLRSKDTDVYCLILLGLYQLYYTRVAPHAAVNETVAEADGLGKPWARQLINAVLREAQRQQTALLETAQKDYAAWYSHPQWLLMRLKQDWPAQYRDLLDGNNARAPMTLRINTARSSRAAYLALLHEAGLPAHAGDLCETSVILAAPCDVHRLPGFAEGLVSVQDEASQLVVPLLKLAPGLRVLDACAAPGGKTCALLEAEPTLQLLAIDNEERRLSRVRDSLARLGLQAEVQCNDITQDHALAPDSFDRILLDVPCSATGVIRRHPDIKLLRTEAEVAVLVQRQSELLTAAWRLLKPGGYLLYSTCSLLKAENSSQISAFLRRAPDALAEPLPGRFAATLEPGLQLFPVNGSHDGFYYALLRK